MSLRFMGSGTQVDVYDESVLVVSGTTKMDFLGGGVTATPTVGDPESVDVTIPSAAAATGWTDDGAIVRLTTAGDSVAVGTAALLGAEKLRVLGTSILEGATTLPAVAAGAGNDSYALQFTGETSAAQRTIGILTEADAGTDTYRLRFNDNGGTQMLALESNGQLLGVDGAVGAPTYSFASDPDTGFRHQSADAVSVIAGGNECARFRWTGFVAVAAVPNLYAGNIYPSGLGMFGDNSTLNLFGGHGNATSFAFKLSGNKAQAAGTTVAYSVDGDFAPASGTADFIFQDWVSEINQTGGANGDYYIHKVSVTETAVGGTGYLAHWQVGGVDRFVLQSDGSVGFFGVGPAAQGTSGADLTNNVASGGTDDQIDNWADLSTYANDAAAIRNAAYQLARKLKQVNDALRDYGLLT